MTKSSFLLILFLAGCGSQPLEQHEYLLRPEKGVDPIASAAVVLLGNIDIASYLDHDGIVLQTGSAEIHGGRQHTWAEPLDHAIRRYLQVAISADAGVAVEVSPLTTGTADAEIEVRIHQLHGTTGGDVRLVAEWLVRTPVAEQVYQFDQSVRQRTDGYSALVDAHKDLLDALAEAIADGLE